MFSREHIERFDASYGIPRKANEQYLPSYNAFWHWAADIGKGGFYVFVGLIEAAMSLLAGRLLDIPGLIILAFLGAGILRHRRRVCRCVLAAMGLSPQADEHRSRFRQVGKGQRSCPVRTDGPDSRASSSR